MGSDLESKLFDSDMAGIPERILEKFNFEKKHEKSPMMHRVNALYIYPYHAQSR